MLRALAKGLILELAILIFVGVYAFALFAWPARVTIAVTPAVIMAGGDVRVTCRVPRDARNRGVTVGIEDYASSFDQLDGANAAITHEKTYAHVPCAAGAAYCVLVDDQAHVERVTHPIYVAGCDSR